MRYVVAENNSTSSPRLCVGWTWGRVRFRDSVKECGRGRILVGIALVIRVTDLKVECWQENTLSVGVRNDLRDVVVGSSTVALALRYLARLGS